MSSSTTIDDLNELLESGFHISGINTRVDFEEKDQKFKVTVKLLKGSENKVVFSEDKQFFEYIIHFKREFDSYGNLIFIYSDDIQQTYNVPFPNPPMKSVYIEIGDRILTNDITVDSIQLSGPGVSSAKAIFSVKPSFNPDFDLIDARDKLTIFDNLTRKKIYEGWIDRIDFGLGVARFECGTAPRRFITEKINVELILFNQLETFYFIAKLAGLTFIAPEGKINLTERLFVVIVPVENLVLESSFKFADVDFYSVFDTKDDLIIRKSKKCQRDADWNVNYVRAKVTVKATNHFDALKVGYAKIQGAIDWVVFRNDLTFPVINEGKKKIFSNYDFFKHYSRIHISPMVYCREKYRESTCIFDTRELLGDQIVIQGNPDEYFKATKSVFEKIFIKEHASLTPSEKKLLLSFHWIARTITSINNSDKLLDLWTAIELIVLRPVKHKQFDDLEIRTILEKLSELKCSEKKLEILREKIKQLNNPPIIAVLRDIIEELGLSISPSEMKLLKLTRKKRNDIVHGNKAWEITNEEIEKLRGIIERILIAIVNTV